MGCHVAVREKTIFGLDQHFAFSADQDGSERMIAMAVCASRDVEGAAQESFVIDWRQRMFRLFSSRAEFFHDRMENSIRLERGRAKANSGRVGQSISHCGADGIIRALAHRFCAEWTNGVRGIGK